MTVSSQSKACAAVMKSHDAPNHFISSFFLLVLACMLLCGCAKPKGPVFEPPAKPIFWPPPPDPPRIHYVGSLLTDRDLKPGKSLGKAIGEAIFGKDDARSMLSPYALCTDGGDRLFVCDSNAQLVHVFNFNTREFQRWTPAQLTKHQHAKTSKSRDSDTPTDARFAQPVGVAYERNAEHGRLFVSDSVAAAIFVFDSDGRFLRTIGSEHLSRPCGIAIDQSRNRLFIADAAKHQVIVLDLDGNLLGEIGSRGSALGEFNFPTNVAIDASGRLFVSDTLNFRVQMFDPEFNVIRQIGQQGDMPGYFSNPKGIALDSEDHLYVIDAHFEAVQIFDLNGRLLMSFGEEGHGPGQFWLPAGIHIDANDRIYVADPYNRRVQVFDYRPEVTHAK